MEKSENFNSSLSLRGITKRFGDKVILNQFSFDFSDSGLYILLGDSGVGKTTLLRIICGLDEDFEGEIIGGGRNATSICFQEHRLFPALSALENVTEVSFDEATEDDVHRAKQILFRLKLSEDDIGLKPRALSGGMKQRVAFARAIMRDAPILILDEPTKEVDREVSSIMRQIIGEEAKKRCVILVTHNAEDTNALESTTIRLSGEMN